MKILDNLAIDDSADLEVLSYQVLRHRRPYVEYVQSADEAFWLCANNGQLTSCRTLSSNGAKFVMKPEYRRLVASGIISCPSSVDDRHNMDDLFEAIREWLRNVVCFEADYHYTLAAAYVILSWFDFRYDALPYLRFLGDFGSGKTTALRALGQLCYRTLAISGVVTPAPLFRIISSMKGTLAVDEADLDSGQLARLLTKILNGGYTRGISIVRMSQRLEPETFDPFGPKLVTSRKEFADESLESRLLTIRMKSHRDPVTPQSDPGSVCRATLIRNGLLFWRMNFSQIQPGSSIFRSGSANMRHDYEARLEQLARPIFDSTPLARQRELEAFFEGLNLKMIEMRAGGLEAHLKMIIKRANQTGNYSIHFNQIYMSLSHNLRRLYSKKHVSRALEILGCERRHGRDGTYVTWTEDALSL